MKPWISIVTCALLTPFTALFTEPARAGIEDVFKFQSWFNWADRRTCAKDLDTGFSSSQAAMKELAEQLPVFKGQEWFDNTPQCKVIQTYARAHDPDSPDLVISIFGSTSVGKSVLFRAIEAKLAGDPTLFLDAGRSASSFEPDVTKQVVVLLGQQNSPDGRSARQKELNHDHPEVVRAIKRNASGSTAVIDAIKARFAFLTDWEDEYCATRAGEGVIVQSPHLPPHVAVVDTPGITHNEFSRERARAAARASDVIVLLVSAQTIANEYDMHLLAETFAESGHRRVVFVYYGDESDIEGEKAHKLKQMLVRASNQLFDTRGGDFGDAVLGAYLMPHDTDVARGLRHPELIPLPILGDAESPEIEGLFASMAKHAYDHKEYGQLHAARMIEEHIRAEIRRDAKQSLATQIYRRALPLLQKSVAEGNLLKFPYKEYKSSIVAKILELDAKDGETWVRFEKWSNVREWWAWARQIFSKKAILQQSTELKGFIVKDHARDQSQLVMNQYVELLRRRIALAPLDKDGDELKALVVEYYRRFPEDLEGRGEDIKKMPRLPDRLSLSLPAIEFLPADAQAAYRALITEGHPEFVVELAGIMTASEMKSMDPSHNAEIVKQRTPGERAFDRATAGSIVAAGAVSFLTAFKMHLSLPIPIFHLTEFTPFVAALATMYPAQWGILDKIRDRRNRKRIDESYAYDQRKEIMSFLRDRVTGGFQDLLLKMDRPKYDALVRIERAIRYFDPGYKAYSPDIEGMSREVALTSEPETR